MADKTAQLSSESHHDEEESAIFRAIPLQPGSLAPLQMLAPASFSGGMEPLAPLKRSSSNNSGALSQLQETLKSSSQWPIDASSIPEMPDYPLERTHVSLDRQVALEQITDRIARVLEAQNLVCCYSDHCTGDKNEGDGDDDDDDEMDVEGKLPGRVDCTSQDKQLKFVLQLYRNSEENTYVVELQRRRGDALAFSAVRRSLFQTLLANGQVNASITSSWSPPPFTPNKKFRMLPGTPLRT